MMATIEEALEDKRGCHLINAPLPLGPRQIGLDQDTFSRPAGQPLVPHRHLDRYTLFQSSGKRKSRLGRGAERAVHILWQADDHLAHTVLINQPLKNAEGLLL